MSLRTTSPRTRSALRIGSGVLALLLVAAVGYTLWYRQVYNVWPGQEAAGSVHWCGRDYQNFGGPAQTWRQISAQAPAPIGPVGQYPPLGWPSQQLLAAVTPTAQRDSVSPPLPCTMIVYLRVGPDRYQPYALEGGP